MRVLEKVAKALSRNYGITVRFEGTRAYTDHKSIVLPMLPDNLDENDEIKVRGYCDHEIGHLLETDYGVTKKAHTYSDQVKNMRNLIEDFRIERDIASKYIGTKVNMERTAQLLIKESKPEDMEHIMTKLWIEGRRQACGYEFKGVPSFEKDVKEAFGENVFQRIKAMGSGKERSIDALNLAIDLVKEYEKRQEQQKQEQNKKEKDKNENSEKNDGDDSSDSGNGKRDKDKSDKGDRSDDDLHSLDANDESSDEDIMDSEVPESKDSCESTDDKRKGECGDDGDDDDSNEQEPSNNGKESSKNGKERDFGSDSDGHDIDKGDDGPGDGEVSKAGKIVTSDLRCDLGGWEDAMDSLQKHVENISTIAVNCGTPLPFSRDFDVIKKIDHTYTRINDYESLKKRLGKLESLKTKISRLFLTRQISRWEFDKEEGKLNTRRLASIKAGNRSVFKEKEVATEMDTSITLLCDCSGSMGYEGVENVMIAVTLMLETLKTTKIKTEILGFTTTGSEMGGAKYKEKHKWTRIEPIVTYIIKEFSEPFNATIKKRIAATPGQARRKNNSDGDSVLVAAERLLKQRSKRKIMFVLSDGNPSCIGNNSLNNKHLKDTVNKLEKIGIEIIGIGMGQSVNVERFYNKYIKIKNTSKITETIYTELKRIMKV